MNTSFRQLLAILLIALCPALLPSCGNFNAFPESSDVELGSQAALQFEDASMAGGPVIDSAQNPAAYQYLRGVVNRILDGGQVQHKDIFAWRIRIIRNDKIQNAVCLPGGFIYVYSGLIKYLDSEDQMAGVLAHEIAHADLRHGTEQLTKQYGIGLLISVATGGNPDMITQIVGNLVSLGFSRHDEAEADQKSVDYLYATAYDARGTARFFEKLIKEENRGGEPPEFISTHPNSEHRVKKITDYWKQKGGKEGQTFAAEYSKFKAQL